MICVKKFCINGFMVISNLVMPLVPLRNYTSKKVGKKKYAGVTSKLVACKIVNSEGAPMALISI